MVNLMSENIQEKINLEPIQKLDFIFTSDKLKQSPRNQKAFIQYMKDQGVENISNLDFKRLNCEIPKELHTWLNVYARSNVSEYKSMTEIVIKILAEFARQRGFRVKD